MANLTALQILDQFNLVDFTNFSTNSDVEGRAVIGGNITSTNSSTYYINPTGNPPGEAASSFAALTVFGNIASSLNLDNSGTAYVGGSGGANINYNGGHAVTTSPPETMSAIQSTMDALETQLAGSTANSTVNSSDANNVMFNASGSTAVFTVTAAQLESWHGLSLNANSATSIIINVTGGGDINLTNGLNLNGGFSSNASNVIWNFENASTVETPGWYGTVLAVDATVSNSSAIDGTVVADAVNASGEIHNYSYAGVICFMAGTRIATPAGAIAIEDLAAGDLVLTNDGRAAPALWIGRQTVSTVFADPLTVLPIRIGAGALGENLPERDLLVSSRHALLIDGVLAQAGALVNGVSIVRETRVPETFVYYHVELADHALLLAEGVPAETFIDNVDRVGFDNWAEHEALYPEGHAIAEMPYPRASSARQVPRAIRDRLAANATPGSLALAS